MFYLFFNLQLSTKSVFRFEGQTGKYLHCRTSQAVFFNHQEFEIVI